MKFNFSKLTLKNVDGTEIKGEVHKELANLIYARTSDLGLVDKAIDIHAGKEVDLTDAELIEVNNLIEIKAQGGQNFFMAFARKALGDYIKSVQAKK